jgi:hypothetical protein
MGAVQWLQQLRSAQHIFKQRFRSFRHPKTILSLLLCCQLYVWVMYSWLWWGGFGATCTAGTTVLHWGGNGSSSARTVVPVVWSLTLAVLILMLITAGHNRWPADSANVPDWIMYPLRLLMNVSLLCTITIQMFLAGFVLSVLTNAAASSGYTIHGCVDPVDHRIWIPWSSVGALLLATLLGHLLIPENASHGTSGVTWTNASATKKGEGTSRAITNRKVNVVMLVITCLLTLLAVVCLWVGFARQRSALSRTADGSEWLCNCAGASNITLCTAAKAGLFDALVIENGAIMWWLLAAAILLSAFGSLIGISTQLYDGKEWINSRGVRYACLTISAVAIAVLGYGLAGLWGAVTRYLTEVCCPTADCVSLANYATAKWALGAVCLWIAAIITGHFITAGGGAPASQRYVTVPTPSPSLSLWASSSLSSATNHLLF